MTVFSILSEVRRWPAYFTLCLWRLRVKFLVLAHSLIQEKALSYALNNFSESAKWNYTNNVKGATMTLNNLVGGTYHGEEK